MKIYLKRLTALFLVFSLCLGLVCTNAFAAEAGLFFYENESETFGKLLDENNEGIYDDAVEFNGSYYYRFDNEMTWSEAKDYCNSVGGCLVAITSEEENEFIKTLLTDNVYKAYWLGGYILEGQWYWLTGETWEYTNWHSGEPNGGSNDMCLQMWWSNNQWKWDDTWNSGDRGGGETEQGFICEWSSEQMAALTAPILSASADGHKKVYLSWTYGGNTEFISRFLIYRSEDDVDYTYIHSVAADTYEYYDTLSFEANEKEFYYKIIAFSESGQRSESNVVQVTAISQDTDKPVAVIVPNELTFANVNENVSLTAAASSDNDIIASYNWDFGDGCSGSGITVSHAYSTVGNYSVTLTVTDRSGNSDKTSVIITVVDINDENSEYTKFVLKICDASSLAVINDAQVTITNDDISDIWNVEQNGILTCIVPNDSYNVSVCADGYIVRTVKIVASGGTVEATIGLSTGSIMIGELTSSEMTYDEIIEAGIDPEAEGNQHIYKFVAVLTFTAGAKEYEIPYEIIKNENGEVIGSSGSGYYTVESSDSGGDSSGSDIRIGVFPISERFVLVIYGEAHWLKEMYKVELLVTNISNTDTLEEVTAELKLPDGLSLADMVDGSQSLIKNLGSIGYSGNARACWYVRGDEEGEYNLTAKVHAVSMPFAEEIEQTFTTSTPVKVYAGSALHMTIIAEDVAVRGKEYTVKFKLENVSDKSIYNFSFGITGSEQYKVVGFGDAEAWIPITSI